MSIYQKYDDELLESMWDELEDVPIDENECLDVDWQGWSKGTHREEIWHWFDEQHSKGVGWLMNERETKYKRRKHILLLFYLNTYKQYYMCVIFHDHI